MNPDLEAALRVIYYQTCMIRSAEELILLSQNENVTSSWARNKAFFRADVLKDLEKLGEYLAPLFEKMNRERMAIVVPK